MECICNPPVKIGRLHQCFFQFHHAWIGLTVCCCLCLCVGSYVTDRPPPGSTSSSISSSGDQEVPSKSSAACEIPSTTPTTSATVPSASLDASSDGGQSTLSATVLSTSSGFITAPSILLTLPTTSANAESASSLCRSSDEQPVPSVSSAVHEISSTSATVPLASLSASSDGDQSTSSATMPSTSSADAVALNVVVASSCGVQPSSSISCSPAVQFVSKQRRVQVSPEDIRPFPKAGQRKRTATNAGRKRGESRILTDTPVKQQIEQDIQARQMKKGINKRKRHLFETPSKRETATSTGKTKKKSDGICKKRVRVLNDKSCGDYCGVCSVAYGDSTDKKSDEEWLQCSSACARWFHDSCAQGFGVLDDDETFICYDCM